MDEDKASLYLAGVYITLVLAGATGWILNIYKLFGVDEILSAEGVLRIVGIIMPIIGAVYGYM